MGDVAQQERDLLECVTWLGESPLLLFPLLSTSWLPGPEELPSTQAFPPPPLTEATETEAKTNFSFKSC